MTLISECFAAVQKVLSGDAAAMCYPKGQQRDVASSVMLEMRKRSKPLPAEGFEEVP